MRACLAAVLASAFLFLGPSVARAQHGPPGPPGPGPGGPGPAGPRPGSGPAEPGPGAPGPGGAAADPRRILQEVRAARLKKLIRNEDSATKLIEAYALHEAAQKAKEDEKAKVLERVGQILLAVLEAKVTGVKGSGDRTQVAISVGSDEMIQAGMVFVLRRGATIVGKATVEKVVKDACEARVAVAEGQKPQEGDAAAIAGLDSGEKGSGEKGSGEKAAGKGEKAGKAEDLPALLDKVTELEKGMRAAEDGLQKKVREILSPADSAKVAVFLAKFESEARAILAGQKPEGGDAPK